MPQSLWIATAKIPAFEPLQGEVSVDVAIVGAGISGITAAFLLKEAGKRVAVLENRRVARGETGRTTAHLTEAIDARYPTLKRDFGEEGARLAASASRDAIDLIERLAGTLSIDCGFRRVPGFLYSERAKDREMLADEAREAAAAGVRCSYVESAPLPFSTAGAVRYENQAQFHPAVYLGAVAARIPGNGSHLFEQTQVLRVTEGEPCVVETTRGRVTARDVIVAANVPSNNKFFIHTKIAAYRSYAIAARVSPELIPAGLYWDTDDPYHYTRTHTIDGEEYIIIGGEDHKTGTEERTEGRYEALQRYAREKFGVSDVAFEWSGQIIEPVDGLPFIGRNSLSSRVFVATGYAGQGMTFGTLSAMINSDLILGRENRYAALFDATRIKPAASVFDYITENVDFPRYLIEQRVAGRDVEEKELSAVAPGDGKIVEVDGKKFAAYRNEKGELHLLSPICPHLHCDVNWNSAESTWDCPCHGSRFSATGGMLNGPATKDLEREELK